MIHFKYWLQRQHTSDLCSSCLVLHHESHNFNTRLAKLLDNYSITYHTPLWLLDHQIFIYALKYRATGNRGHFSQYTRLNSDTHGASSTGLSDIIFWGRIQVKSRSNPFSTNLLFLFDTRCFNLVVILGLFLDRTLSSISSKSSATLFTFRRDLAFTTSRKTLLSSLPFFIASVAYITVCKKILWLLTRRSAKLPFSASRLTQNKTGRGPPPNKVITWWNFTLNIAYRVHSCVVLLCQVGPGIAAWLYCFELFSPSLLAVCSSLLSTSLHSWNGKLRFVLPAVPNSADC